MPSKVCPCPWRGPPGVVQVWVYGNSFECCLVGVVVPDERKMAAALASAGQLPDSYEVRLAAAPPWGKRKLRDLQS